MKPWITNEGLVVLREVLARELPGDALRLVETNPREWSSGDRARARDAIGRELVASGFDADFVPNSRGRLLEDIIDRINRADRAD